MADQEIPKCATCPLKKKAEGNPRSIMARVWKWHTKWCPGWKQYQRYLSEQNTK